MQDSRCMVTRMCCLAATKRKRMNDVAGGPTLNSLRDGAKFENLGNSTCLFSVAASCTPPISFSPQC
jgi:hypothetical protein